LKYRPPWVLSAAGSDSCVPDRRTPIVLVRHQRHAAKADGGVPGRVHREPLERGGPRRQRMRGESAAVFWEKS